ncbi:MAG: hypothetical protein KF866_04590 [Phycisphaeraceae bacterium]|nr:hypothetical protein [Phycisphaeraceae bacterium]
MTNLAAAPDPRITITVDVTNPGQFFACCGLLELADRLWPRAEVAGWFSAPRYERSRFCISAGISISTSEIVTAALNCKRTAVDPYRPITDASGKPVKDAKKTMPVLLGEPLSLRLNWWLDEPAGRQTELKMWGAHQTSSGLINDMAKAVNPSTINDSTALGSPVGMTGRIGLDTRSSWNTLDEGFSPNDQKLPVDTYPATELLAAIGLETFRPAANGDVYVYATWSSPLPVVVARTVASGRVALQGIARYGFQIASRGKFKFLTEASLLERSGNG